MMMGILRMVATAAAGVWLGGMILIAIVAQTTFTVMRTTGVEHPNSIAGQVMARNFSKFDKVQLICAGILIVWQVLRLVMGRRTIADCLRMALILLATGLLVYSASVLTPKITGLQSAVAGPDPEAAVKAIFDDFHETAVRISKINLILVAGIIFSLAWNPRNGRTSASGNRLIPEIRRESG